MIQAAKRGIACVRLQVVDGDGVAACVMMVAITTIIVVGVTCLTSHHMSQVTRRASSSHHHTPQYLEACCVFGEAIGLSAFRSPFFSQFTTPDLFITPRATCHIFAALSHLGRLKNPML
jgi:hypothetical protein